MNCSKKRQVEVPMTCGMRSLTGAEDVVPVTVFCLRERASAGSCRSVRVAWRSDADRRIDAQTHTQREKERERY